MKPYLREKKILGCGKWKTDSHPKKGFINWWETFDTFISRRTSKLMEAKRIQDEIHS